MAGTGDQWTIVCTGLEHIPTLGDSYMDRHMWQFQSEHGIQIETMTLDIPLSQEGDQLLQQYFAKQASKAKNWLC